MSSREEIAKFSVLLKAVPDVVDGDAIRASLKNVKKSFQHNELGNIEIRWIVQFREKEDASEIIHQKSVKLSLFSGSTVVVSVAECPKDIIPEDWLHDTEPISSKTNHKKEPLSIDHTAGIHHGNSSSTSQSELVDGRSQSHSESGSSSPSDSPDVFDWGTCGPNASEATSTPESKEARSRTVETAYLMNPSQPTNSQNNIPSVDHTIYENVFTKKTEAAPEASYDLPPQVPERKPRLKSSLSTSPLASASQGGRVELHTETSSPKTLSGFPTSKEQDGQCIPSAPPMEETINAPIYGKNDAGQESFVTAQAYFDSRPLSDFSHEAPGDRRSWEMGKGPPDQPLFPFHLQQFRPNMMYCPPGPMPSQPNHAPGLMPSLPNAPGPMPSLPNAPGPMPSLPNAPGPMPSLPNCQFPMGMYPHGPHIPPRQPFGEGVFPIHQGAFPQPGAPGTPRNSGDWNPSAVPPHHNPPPYTTQLAPPMGQAENPPSSAENKISVNPVLDSEAPAKDVHRKQSPKPESSRKKREKKKDTKEKDILPAGNGQTETEHIRVRWEGTVSEDALTCFFENKKKSGGGDIEEIDFDDKCKEAIIKFEKSEVTKRVLEKAKTHTLDKAKLQVFAFDPEKENIFEEKILLVSGFKDTTSHDCLENYLEARGNVNFEDILYGDEGGKAIVVFEKPPDFKKVVAAFKRKSLEGNYLEVSRVKKCRSICVSGIDGNIPKDTLELFFESNKRSGGGPVDQLDVQYSIGICIVYFKNCADADNVWRKHSSVTLSGISLQVMPYYPCLGLPRELAQVTIEKGNPPQVTVGDLSPYVVRFFSTSENFKGKLDRDLKTHDAKVIWSGAKDLDSMTIHCTYQPGSKIGKSTLEKWKVDTENIVGRFLDDFIAKKIDTSNEAWKSVIEYLRTVSIKEPEKVGVILEKEKCCVVVVGCKANVEELSEVIQNNIKTREERIAAKKSHITKPCSLPLHQLIILERLQFDKSTMKSLHDVEVKINTSEKTVTFTGPKSELDKAVLKMHEMLNSLTSKSFSISQVCIDLLDHEEAQTAVHKTLKSRKLQSAWVVKPKEYSIEVYGVNSSEIDQAKSAIKDTLPEKIFNLKDSLREFLRSSEWRDCVKKLNSKFDGKMAIASSDQCVSFAAITEVFDPASEEIQRQVNEFTAKHCIGSDFLATNSGRVRYVTTYMEQDLTRITRKFESSKVSISPKVMGRGKTGFVINGDKNDVKKAKQELEEMVKSIQEEKHKISEPGCLRFFGSDEGIKAKQKVESDFQCIIKNTSLNEDSEEKSGSAEKGREKYGTGTQLKHPVEVASCNNSRPTIKVMEGDMTQLNVDAIVNAANNDLDHCGGLAKVIVDAGGYSIQKECDSYVKKNGKVSDGDAMISGPGLMPCKWVIHAVGPRWSGGNINEETDLRKAITKSLELASEKKITSLAVPALSAGIFGYPVDQATLVIVETILFYFKTKEGKDSSVKEIYLCGVDDKIIRSFTKALQSTLGSQSVIVKRREGSYKERRDSSPKRRRESSSSPRRKSKERSDKQQGIEVRIIKGELASQKADVLVNSTHHSLDLSIGATSKSLLRQGGEKLQEECRIKYKSGIRPGEVAITKGGQLQCSQVYHGTLQKFTSDNYEQAIQTMEEFVENCLKTADMNQLQSIAFPALGTGQLGYPADLVASTMYKCISRFEKRKPTSSLEEVLLVVYHKDTATIKAFETVSRSKSTSSDWDADDDLVKHRVPPSREYQTRRRSSQGASSHMSSTIGKLEVRILQGNITTDGSDAIVNSVGERMDLSKGAVSKAILKEGGYRIQEECKSKVDEMRRDGLVLTSAGKLRSKYIIHVKAQKDKDSWKKTVAKALDVADMNRCKSLAFPALGTGGQGCTPEDVAKAIFKAIQNFSPKTLQEVHVVVFQEDMIDSFQQALDSVSEGDTKRAKRTSKVSSRDEVEFKESKLQKPDEVVFILWSNKSKDLRKAVKELDEIVKRECCLEKIKREALVKKLSEKQMHHITSVGRQNGVVVNINTSKGEIVLQGQEKDVTRSKANILEILGDIEKYINEYEKALTMSKFVQWQYKDDSRWRDVNPIMNMQIEEANQAKKAKVTVKVRSGEEFEVDLKKNVEYEKKNPAKKYEIKRIDVGSRGANVVGLPESWESGSKVREVDLKPGSREYDKVKEEFTRKGGPGSNIQNIYRVQNPHLYQQYAAKRKSILERNGKNPERWLWHGTSPDTIKFIINNGFNRSYCGKNGTAYGNGVYFAVNSSYSIGYCMPDQNNFKHMFSAQVLVGEACRGQGGMTVLPQKSGGKNYETYDSASDNPSAPNMYIIFHDSQAYPTYHIVFR